MSEQTNYRCPDCDSKMLYLGISKDEKDIVSVVYHCKHCETDWVRRFHSTVTLQTIVQPKPRDKERKAVAQSVKFSSIVASVSSKPDDIVLATVEKEHIDAYRAGRLRYSWQSENKAHESA